MTENELRQAAEDRLMWAQLTAAKMIGLVDGDKVPPNVTKVIDQWIGHLLDQLPPLRGCGSREDSERMQIGEPYRHPPEGRNANLPLVTEPPR